jgi:hypothetical protein
VTYEDCERTVCEELVRDLDVMDGEVVNLARLRTRIQEVWALGLVGSMSLSVAVSAVLGKIIPGLVRCQIQLIAPEDAKGEAIDLVLCFWGLHGSYAVPVRLAFDQRGTRSLDGGKIPG